MNPQILAYLPLVSPVAILIVVVLGVFFNNRHVDVRISDLRSHMGAASMSSMPISRPFSKNASAANCTISPDRQVDPRR